MTSADRPGSVVLLHAHHDDEAIAGRARRSLNCLSIQVRWSGHGRGLRVRPEGLATEIPADQDIGPPDPASSAA